MPSSPVALQNMYAAELFFFGHNFKICEGRKQSEFLIRFTVTHRNQRAKIVSISFQYTLFLLPCIQIAIIHLFCYIKLNPESELSADILNSILNDTLQPCYLSLSVSL